MEPSSVLKNGHDVSASETNRSPTTDDKYKEIISNLPQEDSWHSPSVKLHKYQEFWGIPSILQGVMSAQEHFKAQPTDIIICSCPKSGTTWLKALCFSILRRTHFVKSSPNPLLIQMPHDIVPFIEYTAHDVHNRDTKPNYLPLWSTHVPYASLPKSIMESSCKIVYICRNPKDLFISLWLFMDRVRDRDSDTEALPLDKAFRKFCEGSSPYGPYWNHVLGYWTASLQFPDRVLFITYEDLQCHTYSNVKRLAEFMGYPFTAEEEKQGLVHEIIELCSFESLSNLDVNKSNNETSTLPVKVENSAFFRKGKIGDWENYLTAEMGAQIDHIIDQKLNGSGLSFAMPTL